MHIVSYSKNQNLLFGWLVAIFSLFHSKINHYQPKIDPWFYTGTVWSVKLAAVDALVAISTGNTLLILLKVGILLKGPNVPSLPTSSSIIPALSSTYMRCTTPAQHIHVFLKEMHY